MHRWIYDPLAKIDPATGTPLYDILLVLDGNGGIADRYLHGPGIDQILAEEQYSTPSQQPAAIGDLLWALADNLGTVRDVIKHDAVSGAVVVANHLTYDSFGKVTSETSPSLDFDYGFTGRERDESTGLIYHRARYGDPDTHTWLNPDPSGFTAGDTNLYRSVTNGPTNATDPSGLRDKPVGPDPGPGYQDPRETLLRRRDEERARQGHTTTAGGYPRIPQTVAPQPKETRSEYWRLFGGAYAAATNGSIHSVDCLDTALYIGQKGGYVVAGAASGAAIVVYAGPTAVAAYVLQEGAETGAEMLIEAATGKSIPIVLVPDLKDIGEGVAKAIAKDVGTKLGKAGRDCEEKLLKEAIEKVGICFAAGTPVLVDGDAGVGDNTLQESAIAWGALAVAGWQRARDRRKKKLGAALRKTNRHASCDGFPQSMSADLARSTWHRQGGSMRDLAAGEDCATARDNGELPPRAADMSSSDGPLAATWRSRLSLVVCLCLAGFFGTRSLWRTFDADASPTASGSQKFVNIEHIRVGDRVLADDPDVDASPATAVNPATWRKLVLRAESTWDDGTVDDINVETLQPPEWVEAHGARVDATVPLPLDLAEMGLPADLRARVIANEACPPLGHGTGRVVLTTVNHLNCDLVELTLRGAHGPEETVRPTGLHRFYRASDTAWVHAHELRTGDQLSGHGGQVTVVAKRHLAGTHRVYNMTVEGEHVYYVSALGVLSHNNGCSQPRIINKGLAGKKHPKTGVSFDKDGFPDFSGVAAQTVPVAQTGIRHADEAAANAAAGLSKTPEGFTWHHHQDGKTMQLVPTGIHQQTGHTGGVALHGK